MAPEGRECLNISDLNVKNIQFAKSNVGTNTILYERVEKYEYLDIFCMYK